MIHFMYFDYTWKQLYYHSWSLETANQGFVYRVQSSLDSTTFLSQSLFAGARTQTITQSDGSSGTLYEAFTVGGTKALTGNSQVDYSDYFGIILTNIESETCLTTGADLYTWAYSQERSFESQGWESISYTESASDILYTNTNAVEWAAFNLDVESLYDYNEEDWCSSPADY